MKRKRKNYPAKSYGAYILEKFGIKEDILFNAQIDDMKALIALLKETLDQQIIMREGKQ